MKGNFAFVSVVVEVIAVSFVFLIFQRRCMIASLKLKGTTPLVRLQFILPKSGGRLKSPLKRCDVNMSPGQLA